MNSSADISVLMRRHGSQIAFIKAPFKALPFQVASPPPSLLLHSCQYPALVTITTSIPPFLSSSLSPNHQSVRHDQYFTMTSHYMITLWVFFHRQFGKCFHLTWLNANHGSAGIDFISIIVRAVFLCGPMKFVHLQHSVEYQNMKSTDRLLRDCIIPNLDVIRSLDTGPK